MAATETICNNTVDSAKQLNANSAMEISSNQEILTLALRTLRLSKSNLNVVSTDTISSERRAISLNEVSYHDTTDDCWIILFDRVYDVTHFLDKVSWQFSNRCNYWMKFFSFFCLFLLTFYENTSNFQHPGGSDIIVEYAGRDASQAFRGHSKLALMSLKQYEIGALPLKECIYRREGMLRYDELPE